MGKGSLDRALSSESCREKKLFQDHTTVLTPISLQNILNAFDQTGLLPRAAAYSKGGSHLPLVHIKCGHWLEKKGVSDLCMKGLSRSALLPQCPYSA